MSERPHHVPDAALALPSDVYESNLGGEASVPRFDVGPSILSRFPDPNLQKLEVRDFERRVRDGRVALSKLSRAGRESFAVRTLVRGYRAVAMRNRSTVVDEFGRDPARAAQAERLLAFLFRRYFRVEVSGASNIPESGGAIIVANRGGVLPLDVVMLMESVRTKSKRILRPLVEDTVSDVPILGTALARIGAVRACRENAERLLSRGDVVAMFPEGAHGARKPLAERYHLKRFGRGGFAKIAKAAEVPIIAAAIVGAEEAVPTLAASDTVGQFFGLPTFSPAGVVPLPSRWRIHFGRPIMVGDDDAGEVAQDVRGRVRLLLREALALRQRAF